jgi:hypothetical protein
MTPVIKRKTYSEDQKEKVSEIIKNVLKKRYVTLKLTALSIKEIIPERGTEIICGVLFGKKKLIFKGSGKGPVDALFGSLVDNLSDEYYSLKNLHFAKFSIEADVEKYLRTSRTDAVVEATLEIDNGCDPLLFRESANSINVVAAKVVLSAVEHFINAERCVIMLYNNIQNAKKRNRGDMVNIYTGQLAEVVKNISYENVISRLKETS